MQVVSQGVSSRGSGWFAGVERNDRPRRPDPFRRCLPANDPLDCPADLCHAFGHIGAGRIRAMKVSYRGQRGGIRKTQYHGAIHAPRKTDDDVLCVGACAQRLGDHRTVDDARSAGEQIEHLGGGK